MKKLLITLVLMMALATAAQADDYPYLAFQTADGTVKAVSVTSLKLTFEGGQLVATNGDGSYAFDRLEQDVLHNRAHGNRLS